MGTTRREYHAGKHGGPHDSEITIRWGLLYNLYADRLLGFNMFPQSVYETREFVSLYSTDPCVDGIEPVQ